MALLVWEQNQRAESESMDRKTAAAFALVDDLDAERRRWLEAV